MHGATCRCSPQGCLSHAMLAHGCQCAHPAATVLSRAGQPERVCQAQAGGAQPTTSWRARRGCKFVLPEPGFLEGVKTKDRPILKMMKVAFKCAAVPGLLLNSTLEVFSTAKHLLFANANDGVCRAVLLGLLCCLI